MVTQQTLLEQLGSSATPRTVDRLHRFAYIPDIWIDRLAKDAVSEGCGPRRYALEKYLADHVAWSIEQGQFVFQNDQLYVAAGSLQTRYGTPRFLAFAANRNPDKQLWALAFAG